MTSSPLFRATDQVKKTESISAEAYSLHYHHRHYEHWWKGLKTRDSTEIIGLILQAVEGKPLTRSKILYHTMLNFKQINDYKAFLIQEGLLRHLMLDRKYAITNKGRQFLALFNETNKLLSPLDGDNTAGDNLLAQNQQQQEEVTVLK